MLLILLFVKHFIADFPLQTQWIVKNKGALNFGNWFYPFFFYAVIHAFLTLCILRAFTTTQQAIELAFFDLVIHFVVDRLKAHPRIGGQFPFPTKNFWNALGADQLLHHLTYIWIFYAVYGGF